MKKLLVVVSILLLVLATTMQAERQRIFMWHQAQHQADLLRTRVYFFSSNPEEFPQTEIFESFMGNINIVGVLFHPEHLDQPPTYTVALGPGLGRSDVSPEDDRNNRRIAQLEASAINHARELIASLEQDDSTVSSIYDGSDNLRRLRIGVSDLNPTDEGFHFTWVAEAFPLRAALRQLIPIYIMTALLLTALFLPRKKHTPKENSDV